jgi:DNA repair exonuclease SbcCD ATPase subunit
LTQFRAAAKSTKAAYLPALQALAWVHLQKNEYSQGLPALIELARRIEESKGNWPTDHDKEHSAEWLGRVIGYLAGPGTSADHAAQIEDAANSIEKSLSDKRKQAYEQGRKSISKRHDELKALAARPPNEVLSEARKMREETLAAAQAAAATVKQIEEEIRSIKKPFDQQIVDAEKEMRSNAMKSKKLAKEVPDAEDAVEALSQPQVNVKQVRPSRSRPTGMQVQNETAQQKKAREGQLATAKQQLEQLHSSISNAKQSTADARSQKEKAKADLRKALANKHNELAEAQRASHDLAARAKDAEHAILTPEKLKSRVTALETYVPLEPETEKTHLLATLKSP